jgi:hypothetical protein
MQTVSVLIAWLPVVFLGRATIMPHSCKIILKIMGVLVNSITHLLTDPVSSEFHPCCPIPKRTMKDESRNAFSSMACSLPQGVVRARKKRLLIWQRIQGMNVCGLPGAPIKSAHQLMMGTFGVLPTQGLSKLFS